MSFFVAVTDSPVGDDLSVEKRVLRGMRVEKVSWTNESSLVDALSDADAVLCMHAPMTAGVIDRLPRCRVIATFGTGVDNIDVEAARARGIFVSGVDDYCTEEVATHTIALILAWNRKLFKCQQFVLDGTWNQRKNTTGNWGFVPIHRLSELTLGLVGFGHIAQAVARRAGAFGMRIIAYGRHPNQKLARKFGVEMKALDEVLSESDFVSLHIPLTDQTRDCVDQRTIQKMKKGAVLVNTGRGALVDETALLEGLSSGHLGGALIDVYRKAPLPLDHPLRRMPNVILTPHVAFYSEGALRTLRERASQVVLSCLDGEGKTEGAK